MDCFLPTRALRLIKQYSNPQTRPDWRKGSYISRNWGTYEGLNMFPRELIYETSIYDKIYQEVEDYKGNDLFASNYLPTPRAYFDLYKHNQKISNVVDTIIVFSINN